MMPPPFRIELQGGKVGLRSIGGDPLRGLQRKRPLLMGLQPRSRRTLSLEPRASFAVRRIGLTLNAMAGGLV